MKAYGKLESQFNPIVIEGAGSISEINLRDKDITNMRVALAVNAAVILVADIDRGGAFAHLFGPATMTSMAPLIRRVNDLGMEFGLWVEPEMVNPDSDLYRAHPDWVIHFAGRPRSEARTQLVLNLAHPDAFAHVFGQLDALAGGRTSKLEPRLVEPGAEQAAFLSARHSPPSPPKRPISSFMISLVPP